jgi:hypothetical protein
VLQGRVMISDYFTFGALPSMCPGHASRASAPCMMSNSQWGQFTANLGVSATATTTYAH